MSDFNCRIGRKIAGRQYAAAKTDRLTGDWLPVNQNVNAIIRSSAFTVRSRIRQMVRDFPFFAKARKNLINYTVGDGIKFQSRVIDQYAKATNGRPKIDRILCQKIEDAVEWAMEELDTAGKMHGYEMERLAKGEDVEAGEFIFVKTTMKAKGRFIPYALQQYEAEWLSSAPAGGMTPGYQFDQGIEFDEQSGRAIAYHFAVPSGYTLYNPVPMTKIQRIPAEFVIHNFDMLRPGQLRGVSPFVTAVMVAHDLGDFLDATMDVAKMAAKYLGIITTTDAGRFQRGRTEDGQGVDQGKKLESIENAIFEYLRPGETVAFAQHHITGDNFDPYTRFVLRMVAIATDTTFELLTSDYSGLNFSSLKGIMNNFSMMIRPHQFRHINHFTKPVTRDLLDSAVLAGRIEIPGYWKNPRFFQRGVFIAPGMESPDPLRETKAWIDQIRSGLRSPQEIAAARGRDLDDILDEIQDYYEMLRERGLTFIINNMDDALGTALSNNPAANGAEEESGTATKTAKVINLRRVVSDALDTALLYAEGDE